MRPRNIFLALLFSPLIAPPNSQVSKKNLDVQRSASRPSAIASSDMKPDRCFRPVLENDRVCVFRVELGGLQSTSLDYHRHDYIVVSLGKSNFEIAGSGIRDSIQMEDGEMQVIKGGASHRITNLSENSLHLVEMEIMRGIHPERPLCGLGGHACTGRNFWPERRGQV